MVGLFGLLGAGVSIVAAGDVMLGRGVEGMYFKNGSFAEMRLPPKIAEEIEQADLATCNLECPLTASALVSKKKLSLRAKPEAAEWLANTGFDIVSVANNHTMDCGQKGLEDTRLNLANQGIAWFGDLPIPRFLNLKGIRVGFLGYCDFPQDAHERLLTPGKDIAKQLAEAKKKVDVLVVSFHWGIEGDTKPSSRQRSLAKIAAESGADLIIGSHTHTLQPLEQIRVGRRICFVAYSLGNFVFDSQSKGGILKCVVTKMGAVSCEVVPISITHCLPAKG